MQEMKKRSIYFGVLFLTLFLPFMGTTRVSAQDSSLTDIVAAGEIHVGLEAGYPPFEVAIPDTDPVEYEGFDVDIIEYVASLMGVDVVYHDVAWSVILTNLALGDYDIICSAMTITAAREEEVDFTRWYVKSTQAVMVTMDNPAEITSVEDINSTDVIIGYQAETTSQWYCEDEGIVASQTGFNTITLAIQALVTGAVDVVIGDYAPLADGKASIDPDGFAIIDTFSPEDFGIACQDGATALRTEINTHLDTLLGADEAAPVFSSNYTTIFTEWFGVPPATEFAVDEVPTGGISIPGFSPVGLIAAISIASTLLIRKNKK
jgi:polar amino acid transport system substrate-binding protein